MKKNGESTNIPYYTAVLNSLSSDMRAFTKHNDIDHKNLYETIANMDRRMTAIEELLVENTKLLNKIKKYGLIIAVVFFMGDKLFSAGDLLRYINFLF